MWFIDLYNTPCVVVGNERPSILNKYPANARPAELDWESHCCVTLGKFAILSGRGSFPDRSIHYQCKPYDQDPRAFTLLLIHSLSQAA